MHSHPIFLLHPLGIHFVSSGRGFPDMVGFRTHSECSASANFIYFWYVIEQCQVIGDFRTWVIESSEASMGCCCGMLAYVQVGNSAQDVLFMLDIIRQT